MAGIDYLKCEICAERIMYEPNRDLEIKVVCMKCYNEKIDLLTNINDLIESINTEIYKYKTRNN